MSNSQQIVFVDESGDNVLNSRDDQAIYTITALLINADEYGVFKALSAEIVGKFAGTGLLKSSKVSDNLKRRQEILKAIAQAKFPFYCLVVDKDRIWRDSGLRFKPVFYKFLHKMFYSNLKRSFSGMKVISDPYGSTDFMNGFIKYVESNITLFDSIEFVRSVDEPLLQISDFIAGSIRRVYLEKDPEENLKILGYPSIPIEEWPPNTVRFSDFTNKFETSRYNNVIRRIAVGAARDFVYHNLDNSDDELKSLAMAARYLLLRYHQNPTEYVLRQEVIAYLSDLGISTNSREILSKLRENHLIITSTEQGVKIPYDTNDIAKWVDRVNSQVVPYLHRFKKARIDILIASGNEYDILNPNQYPDLLDMINR